MDQTTNYNRVVELYRHLTFKAMKGWLTDCEVNWYNQATKAFYERFARSARQITAYRVNLLAKGI
jgi:hypothetical protein